MQCPASIAAHVGDNLRKQKSGREVSGRFMLGIFGWCGSVFCKPFSFGELRSMTLEE